MRCNKFLPVSTVETFLAMLANHFHIRYSKNIHTGVNQNLNKLTGISITTWPSVMYQSIQAVKIPRPDPLGIFLRRRNPHPRQKRLQNPGPGAKIHLRKSSKAPPPGQNKTEEINLRYTLKRHRNVLEMGISIKQNHLLKLKYSVHISETVFRIVVLIN